MNIEDCVRSIVCAADQLDCVNYDTLMSLVQEELKDVADDEFRKVVEKEVTSTWLINNY